MRICVFCSSSSKVGEAYFQAAADLGRLIAAGGHTLVYGGCDVGVMGAIAHAAKRAGGKVLGVVPCDFDQRGLTYRDADQIIMVNSLAERKAAMEGNADAFIALPGGLGTLDELAELLTLKQLGYTRQPLAIVNTNGFYSDLLQHLERMYREQFAKPEYRALYHISPDPSDAVEHIERYVEQPPPPKWFPQGQG